MSPPPTLQSAGLCFLPFFYCSVKQRDLERVRRSGRRVGPAAYGDRLMSRWSRACLLVNGKISIECDNNNNIRWRFADLQRTYTVVTQSRASVCVCARGFGARVGHVVASSSLISSRCTLCVCVAVGLPPTNMLQDMSLTTYLLLASENSDQSILGGRTIIIII